MFAYSNRVIHNEFKHSLSASLQGKRPSSWTEPINSQSRIQQKQTRFELCNSEWNMVLKHDRLRGMDKLKCLYSKIYSFMLCTKNLLIITHDQTDDSFSVKNTRLETITNNEQGNYRWIEHHPQAWPEWAVGIVWATAMEQCLEGVCSKF